MKQYFYLTFFLFICCGTNAQILLDHNIILDSLKSRANTIHSKLFKAINQKQLVIYDFKNQVIDPYSIFGNPDPKIQRSKMDTATLGIKEEDFMAFSFAYRKSFDHESLNTSLEVEYVDVSYFIVFAFVNVEKSFYRIKYTDLKNVLSSKDWEFMKCLSIVYHDYYFTSSNKFREIDGSLQVLRIMENDYIENEKNRARALHQKDFRYNIVFDTMVLDMISRIFIYTINREIADDYKFVFYKDENMVNMLKPGELKTNLFDLLFLSYNKETMERTTYTYSLDNGMIKQLVINKNNVAITFEVDPEYKEQGSEKYTMDNQPLQTYYIKNENLTDFFGGFGYKFIKNVIGF